jgi:hypothetical protein
LTADPLAVAVIGPNSANCKFSAGGIISGNVTDIAHNPISNAQITVYDPNQKSTAYGTTDAAGNYSAKRLRTGNYKVLFKGPYGSTLAYEWYNNQSAFSPANGVPVTAGSTTPHIDAQLLEGGTIAGSTGTATGVLAKVYDPYGTSVAYAISEANGAFSVVGLPTGMYRVEFIKYDLASTWYNGHRTFDSADWVLVTAPATTSGINGSLLPGQVISGTVTNTQGAGIPKVTVRAYDGPTFKPMSSTNLTNSLGEYTLNYLSSGSTLVYYDSQGTGYYPEWWDDKKIMAEANPITLVPGVAYPNRDAVLDISQEVYLPLIHKN